VTRAPAGFLAVTALRLLSRLPPSALVALGTPWIPFYAVIRRGTRRRLAGLRSRVPFVVPSPLAYYRMRLRLAALSVRHLAARLGDAPVRVEGEEHFRAATASGKPVALLGWHQGPVELLHRHPEPMAGKPFFIATAAAFSPPLSRWMRSGREQAGKETVNAERLPRALRAWARGGGVLAVMLDQVSGDSAGRLALWNGAVEIPFPRNLWDWLTAGDAALLAVSVRLERRGSVLFRYHPLTRDVESFRGLMEREITGAADQYNWSYPKIRTPETKSV
jgi:lauroyl/myristoyl acyltransferase